MNLKNEIRKENPFPFPTQRKNTGVKYLFAKKSWSQAFVTHARAPRAHGMCENAWNQLFFANRYFTPVFFLFLAREWVFPF